ncbi:MAG: hypothetical protein CMH50_02960 [Myxococcales bacterium]|nr:hypothetical protein [Myxococcales bacterium]
MSTEEPISDTENIGTGSDSDDIDDDISVGDDISIEDDNLGDDNNNDDIDDDDNDDSEIVGSDDDDETTNLAEEGQIGAITSDDSDDSDDEDYDDDYLQKFSSDMKKSIVDEYHTDAQLHNNAEIKQLAVCVKNSQGIVVDELHKTVPIMSKFEYTRILGIRAKQINNGSKPFVKVPDGIIDGYVIAKIELEKKVLPFIIRRPIPSGGSEYWKIKDLEILMQ